MGLLSPITLKSFHYFSFKMNIPLIPGFSADKTKLCHPFESSEKKSEIRVFLWY